jgi:HPt (histidine-containing phosphotransfer) domain-containing protein
VYCTREKRKLQYDKGVGMSLTSSRADGGWHPDQGSCPTCGRTGGISQSESIDTSGHSSGVLTTLQILNPETLSTLADALPDRLVVLESLEMFVSDLPQRLERVDAARADEDRQELKLALDTLVSPAEMLGAEELAYVCRRAMAHCDQSSWNDIDVAATDLHAAAQKTENFANAYLSVSKL